MRIIHILWSGALGGAERSVFLLASAQKKIGMDVEVLFTGSGYTFYLGSGTGFPPMGLILGIDGILRGTPTGKGSNFEVCVKDVGGNSVCRTFHLKVNSECITTIITTTTTNNGNCPTTSNPPCHSIQNGVAVSGVIVPASCNCPSDTTYAGMDNTAPGGPYKICTCK